MNSIQLLSDIDSLYISHNWRDSGVSAISRLKQVLLQQIFGLSVSHASYLKMRKDMIKSRMNIVIQIVILYDFFIRTCYVVNICFIVISTVGRNPFVYLLCGFLSRKLLRNNMELSSRTYVRDPLNIKLDTYGSSRRYRSSG